MQSFTPIHFFVFKIRTIENGFADPKRFRDFRETGPRVVTRYVGIGIQGVESGIRRTGTGITAQGSQIAS